MPLEMDTHIESELYSAIYHYPGFVPELLSGDVNKFQAIEKHCRANDPHYAHTHKWLLMPEHVSKEQVLYEPTLAILNTVKRAVDHVHPPPPSPVANAPTEPPQLFTKPKLVLFQGSHQHWGNIRMPIEVKTSPGLHKAGMKQLSRYARATFAHQLYRRHLYSLLVCGTEVTFVRFDRAGILYSQRMDVVKDAEAFTRAFASLLMLDRIDEGYDPAFTFERNNEGRLEYYIDLPESAFSKTSSKPTYTGHNGRMRPFKVAETLCHRESICGRATIVLRIREDLNDDTRDARAAPWQVWARTIDILRCVDAWQMLVSQSSGRVVCDLCRHDNAGRWIAMQTIGVPLWQAESPRQFLTAILDAILGYWGAFNLGIMHRDISDGNVMIVKKGQKFSRKEWVEKRTANSCIQLEDPALMESETIFRSILEEIEQRHPTGMLSDFDLCVMHLSVPKHTPVAKVGTAEPVFACPPRRHLEEDTAPETSSKKRKVNANTAVPVTPTSYPGQMQSEAEPQAPPQREKRSLIDFRIGTREFMSISVLLAHPGIDYHHHFLDGLESFLWLVRGSAS
ncbi:hypothetical protein RSOLAG22IIIB_04936 [Rhizoctonia solani]|uniref:Fungal-type protein kinase domain-containing protein n=1 Tax=Rhizoctonia solani TaxID=456999 RepID=A0A0K6G2E7_9AGAM|nr:hypothetical protein RSOLAG22IIIB_04936 [Rhizoctonia solani]